MKIQMAPKAVMAVFFTLAMAGVQTTSAEEVELPDMGRFEFAGDEAILQLTQKTGHPQVIVDLGDGQEYTFIVDTGASVNVLDSSVAKRLGYEVTGETEIGAPGGPQIPGDIVRVPLASVGDAQILDAEFVTMDIHGFSMGMTDGVLGLGLFSDFLLTYDQANGRIKVTRDRLVADEPGVIAYTDLEGHIQVDMEVAGTTVATHIDTGSMGDFMLPAELQPSIPLKSAVKPGPTARLVGGERKMTQGQLDGVLRFAGFEFQDPNLVFMEPSPGYGNIGMGVMGDMEVSIDQQNKLIRFHKPVGAVTRMASGGAERRMVATGGSRAMVQKNTSGERRRIGVMFRGMGDTSKLKVTGVAPGSLAETAGFQAGDRLVAINGRPAGDYEMSELGALFGGQAPLTFDIEREGEVITLKIQ